MAAGKHILIVEDEEHLAIGIKYNLEAEGYQVTSVAEGPAALARLEEEPAIDLVILDIMLPGMSGYTVCETLRERGSFVPVLLLTARTLPEDRARGFDAGANQYLTKPFELDELLSRTKNLLRLHANRPPLAETTEPEVYRFGAAVVDFTSHEVRIDGQPVRMTKLELELLKYFLTNEGRVISREELLREVWRMPPLMNSRAPDQFVSRLRKAFEREPSSPKHFLTVREAGYRFVAAPSDPGHPADEDAESNSDDA